jgi:hypothetical protein
VIFPLSGLVLISLMGGRGFDFLLAIGMSDFEKPVLSISLHLK